LFFIRRIFVLSYYNCHDGKAGVEGSRVKKLEQGGLHERVIDAIGQGIVGGEFQEESPLPTEAEMCKTLGVSRTALREALRVLAAKGLVEARRKVGTLVRARERWNYLDPDVLAWRLRGKDADGAIRELYELRHLIEPLAAALAARNAKPADLQKLREAYEEMLAAGDDGARIAGPDLRFHQAIIAASGNRLFSSLGHVLGSALAVNFDLVQNAPRGHRHSMPAHRKVLDAIDDKNAAAARLAMQKLIEESQHDARSVRNLGRRRLARKTHKSIPSL
jgi:DNA-binding FadR family transcriptional regulator